MNDTEPAIIMFAKHYLANRLRALRAERGWRQKDLAEAAGVYIKRIEDWERGERMPKLANLEKLAKAFGLTVEKLLNP